MTLTSCQTKARRRHKCQNTYLPKFDVPQTSASYENREFTEKTTFTRSHTKTIRQEQEKLDNHLTRDRSKSRTRRENMNERRNWEDIYPCRSTSTLNWSPTFRIPWLICVALILLTNVQVSTSLKELRCGTIDIRNSPDGFVNRKEYGSGDTVEDNRAVNCTVIEGSFVMAMIESKNKTINYPRFEHLREITGSLLVYSASGLKSLSTVFPNLRVIGGQTLIQHYSLVIYTNHQLEELGLNKLSLIRNGGVRITENKLLCHSKTIDWKHLIASKLNDVRIDDAVEASLAETGKICPRTQCEDDPDQTKCRYVQVMGRQQQSCWTSNDCQRACDFDRIGDLPGPGCDALGRKCHDECVGGCRKPNDSYECYACKNMHYQGKCIPQCAPNMYALLNRRCVTKETCLGLQHYVSKQVGLKKMKATNGICAPNCPENYEENPNNESECIKCVSDCQKICHGDITVNTISRAMALKGCHIIDGYLTVELRITSEMDMAQIGEYFEKIHTIKGYLQIQSSPSFVNFYFFKSLRVIKGDTLRQSKYALSVYENKNLKKLFNPDVPLKIEKGFIQFHNNQMLCYQQIMQFMERLGRTEEIRKEDQSAESNGYKAICDESTFDVKVILRTHNTFALEWPNFNTTNLDHRKFLGYAVYYKEVPRVDERMSIDDDRSACSDSWERVHVEAKEESMSQDGKQVSEVLITDNIRANTIYAYYVQTQLVVHEGARNAISKLGFVTTLFTHPEPPKLTKTVAETDSITLVWDPPVRPNGVITHYTISWREIDKDLEYTGHQFCNNEATMDVVKDLKPDDELEMIDSTSSTTAPTLTGMFANQDSNQGTCAKISGCCECSAMQQKETDLSETEENTEFENKLQNMVFIQSKMRHKRSIDSVPIVDEITAKATKKPLLETTSIEAPTTRRPFVDMAVQSVKQIEDHMIASRLRQINVTAALNKTSNKYTITGLKHFTDYSIMVSACQNVSVSPNFCSPGKKASIMLKTKKLPDVDEVRNETIHVEHLNTSWVRVTWDAPEQPNGGVAAYKVTLVNVKLDSAQNTMCVVNAQNFSTRDEGVVFKALADGDYRVELRTLSTLGLSLPSSPSDLVTIHTPSWWTLQRILILIACVTLFLLLVGGISYYFVKKYYGEKVKEYATQLISANPDYLSQGAIYKPDEWELNRNDILIEEEIGSGTFGNVFRGRGNNILSQCGETFGECAIKTVMESANKAERIHFLLEANVMKTFKSSFIIKLFGVVSDGQPVLVVMEMMALGNLRDYLRKRRPGGDENTENLPPPSKEELHEWAAQIADGMAYLESIKFCHRDLAARNCMVHANGTVKIGDFGMARDLYYHEYYKPTGTRLMPMRWMAPESLKDGKFDSKTDLWSYGVVIYEMMTLGAQPYQGLANDEVLNFIGTSRRIMDQPVGCPDFWYNLMRQCWKYQPKDRPTFSRMVRRLEPYTSAEFKKLSFVLNNLENDELEPEPEADYVEEPAAGTSTDKWWVKAVERAQEEYAMRDMAKSKSISSNESILPHLPCLEEHVETDEESEKSTASLKHETIDEEAAYVAQTNSPMRKPLPISDPLEDGDYVENSAARDNEAYCLSNRSEPAEKGNSFEMDAMLNGHRNS